MSRFPFATQIDIEDSVIWASMEGKRTYMKSNTVRRFLSFMKQILPRIGPWRSAARSPSPVSELGVREAYRFWAATYATETATSSLDEDLARKMLRGLPQTRLLDAGCGIGRRIQMFRTL